MPPGFQLHEAHDIVYNSGFYKGTMIAGAFAGLPVIEAKPKCKAAMVEAGQAFIYLEPEGAVTPRSTPDVECVVAMVDQWYLRYGEEEWATAVRRHLDSLECFNPQARGISNSNAALLLCSLVTPTTSQK